MVNKSFTFCQEFEMRFPVFPPAGAAGASLANTIYPALAAQQLEQDQEEMICTTCGEHILGKAMKVS